MHLGLHLPPSPTLSPLDCPKSPTLLSPSKSGHNRSLQFPIPLCFPGTQQGLQLCLLYSGLPWVPQGQAGGRDLRGMCSCWGASSELGGSWLRAAGREKSSSAQEDGWEDAVPPPPPDPGPPALTPHISSSIFSSKSHSKFHLRENSVFLLPFVSRRSANEHPEARDALRNTRSTL